MSLSELARCQLRTLTRAALALAIAAAVPLPGFAQELTTDERAALWRSRGCIDDERGEWFRDAKFGAIIHFGLYSQLGGYYEGEPYTPSEQIIGLGERRAAIPWETYRDKVGGSFNPEKFDAAAWVGMIKKAGQKYVILTTKHHDGFCMFRTATTAYNVVEATPFKRDVVKEVAEECRKQGLVFCPYYSIGDWTAADVQNAGFKDYKGYMEAQLRELLTNYGEIKLLWFDNWWYVNNQWTNDEAHAMDLYAFARSIRPNILVNDRCGSGSRSHDGDYATPENQLKGSLQSRYFEVVMTNTDDDHWGWVRGTRNYRTPRELIRNLIDSVSKGGNFVLNVGPMANGEFPPEHVAILESMGAWTRANSEAIYGTRPAPELGSRSDGGLVYTTRSKNGESWFAHVAEWPKDILMLRLDRPAKVKCELVDRSLGEISYSTEADGAATQISIARPARLDPNATVIRLTLEK